jgi:cytochrome c
LTNGIIPIYTKFKGCLTPEDAYMISRFFKKKPKAAEPKKTVSEKAKQESPREIPSQSKKLLTAEGWKRIMMRKTGKKK